MRSSRCLWSVMIAVLGMAGPPVIGQDSDGGTTLSKATMTSTVVLTNVQQGEIDRYVSHWAGVLIDEADALVPLARVELTAPFRTPGATDIFLGSYGVSVSRKLAGAVSSEQRIVTRLNAMIVLRLVAAAEVEDRISSGLQDANPAVRYLAGKAAGALGSRRELGVEQKQAILGALARAFRNEADPLVSGQLLLGLLGLRELPRAQQELLKGLDKRITDHAVAFTQLDADGNRYPSPAVDADFKALNALYKYTLQTVQGLSLERARPLVRVAFRLFSLSATVLNDPRADEGMDKQYVKLVGLGDTILRDMLKQLGVTEGLPSEKELSTAVLNKRYDVFLDHVEQWRILLIGLPLELSAEELEVRFP